MNPILEFCERFGYSLREAAKRFKCSASRLSAYSRSKKPLPYMFEQGIAEVTRQEAGKKRTTDEETVTQLVCPRCGARPRLRSDYLKHWFHGRLKDHATCSGTTGSRHQVVSFGILPHETEWQPLDAAKNPNTQKEVLLPLRRRVKTSYERRHGWVWCPECGGMCLPGGKYTHHYRGSETGTTYNIFRCFNHKCRNYRRRLKCLNGKAVLDLEHRGRFSNLPPKARTCPHCNGKTVANGKHLGLVNGVPRELIRVRCKGDCKKPRVFYFDVSLGRFFSLKLGGPRADDNRPICRKGDTMISWRIDLHRYRRFRARVPSAIRAKIDACVTPSLPAKEIVVVRYECRHKTVWKLPNGVVLLTQHRRRAEQRSRDVRDRAPLLAGERAAQ